MPLKGETKADRVRRVEWLTSVASEVGGEGCREWPWSKSTKGYGDVGWEGRVRRVGHVVLELTNRPRPTPQHHQLHSCDNPSCAAPWHLRWGTNGENRDDAISRGRHFTKLTHEQVRSIYASTDTQRSLAGQYGVNQRVIWAIRNGRAWTRATGHRIHEPDGTPAAMWLAIDPLGERP